MTTNYVLAWTTLASVADNETRVRYAISREEAGKPATVEIKLNPDVSGAAEVLETVQFAPDATLQMGSFDMPGTIDVTAEDALTAAVTDTGYSHLDQMFESGSDPIVATSIDPAEFETAAVAASTQATVTTLTANPDFADISADTVGPVAINLTGNDQSPVAGADLSIGWFNPQNMTGTVSIAPNGDEILYDHTGLFHHLNAGQTVVERLYYRVDDGTSVHYSYADLQIVGVNDAPIATDDTPTISEDAASTRIELTGNDADFDQADTPTIHSIDTNVTVGLVTLNPGNASVQYDPNGAYTHLKAGETATDTFTYTLRDSSGATDTATVTVTINGVNAAPDAAPDSALVNFDDATSTTINLTGNDTDTDVADDLEITSIDTTGTLGTVTINADNDTVEYNPNGQFAHVLGGQTTTDSFTYTISDGDGGSDTATVTVTIQNTNPSVAVDGLDTAEFMGTGYTDAQGDQIGTQQDLIYGNGGDDTIFSGEGVDTVYGGGGDDRFLLSYGPPFPDNDVIIGGETDEDNGGDVINATVDGSNPHLSVVMTSAEAGTIAGSGYTATFSEIERFNLGEGNDTFIGAESDDYVHSGEGRDSLLGYGGDDTLIASIGRNYINGGTGNDSIVGDDLNDTLIGGTGDDTIHAGRGYDVITTGSGNDVVTASFGNDINTASGSGLADSIAGEDANDDRDMVTGGDAPDEIVTGDDSDTINSGDGDDTIDAGIDDDFIDAGNGQDSVIGGEGNDSIEGGAGADTIKGEAGNDTLLGGSSLDDIKGGSGNDLIFGGADKDYLFGDGDNDTIYGEGGHDDIWAGYGADSVFGGDDRDEYKFSDRAEAFGDTYDGGTGGDDNDQLDLSGKGLIQLFESDGVTPLDTGTFSDADGDSHSGVVKFLDGSGAVEGTLVFSEIEHLIVCFAAGTGIATPTGDRAVETLEIGDMVLTADGNAVPVKWLGRNTVHKYRAGARMQPVRFKAGALGRGLPHNDLTVTADHGMILGGYVINASALVNGATIDFVPLSELPDRITYFHIETDAHNVILANGAPTETFVDAVGRAAFDNYQEFLNLYGVERIIPEMDHLRISSARLIPESIRQRLELQGNVMASAKPNWFEFRNRG